MFIPISGVLTWINTHSKSSGTIESTARVPKLGDIRVSPIGANQFTVERYTAGARWVLERQGSEEDCDKWVDKYFEELREQRERDRKYSEAVTKHTLANPVRYLRLE